MVQERPRSGNSRRRPGPAGAALPLVILLLAAPPALAQTASGPAPLGGGASGAASSGAAPSGAAPFGATGAFGGGASPAFGAPGAQDPATFALRGAGFRAQAAPASAGSRPRTPPRRRSRPPTTALVRQITQVPPEDLRLRPTVQFPVSGLPDIGLVPILLRRRPVDPLDPYSPLGIRVGGVTLYPALQQGIGYDTNPDRASLRRASLALRTDGELRLQSDWSSHQLSGELRGGYSEYPDNKAANRPDGDGAVRLRLDVARDTRVDVEGRYLVTTQRAGSPDLSAAVRDRPVVAAYGGTVGATQTFNRLQVTVAGLVDRQTFEDAELTNGTILRQSDRNANQYGLRLRTGYEIRPGFTPFVDVLLDTRVHDFAVDFNGYRRDSDGITARGGTTFEVSRLVTGEISGGYLKRTYADTRLRDLSGPVVDGALLWAVTPLTAVRLGAATGVTETVVLGASGILTRSALAEVTHDLRRNLRLTLSGTVYSNTYQGANIKEEGYIAGVKLDYRLNRWLGIRASYAHEMLRSNAVGSSYHSDTYLVGVRVNP
ncbi:hypothetical protein OPKNFCMD_4760 [Methylobacterium crusticola]|uniref:Outer membrane beta-barrel protein n=1 Tax=Methylobacterium crusticola TaxID=1697972 RepID=A0ABQ4R4D2_9HYPH|nr:outer membrane beta-barrel protein [Methylobacterium crusticola]GJD51999.1 hypothetical protein OPKNFCMD_4760 [Methylobacterium crusticola]